MSRFDYNRTMQTVNPAWVLCIIWALYGVVNIHVVFDFVEYGFKSGTYAHGILFPPLCLYLIFDAAKRDRLRYQFSLPALLLAASLSLIMCASVIGQIAPLYRVLFPAALAAYVVSVFRPNIAVLFPVFILYFATPVWSVLNSSLQDLSVFAVSMIVSMTSIPTHVDGNFISIPSGTFEIAGGCNGLRYLLVASALGSLYAYFNLRGLRSILMLMAIFVIGSLIVNWIRIVALIMIGHFSEMTSSLMHDHDMFGWYIFVPCFALMLWIAGRIESSESTADSVPGRSSELNRADGFALLATVLPMTVISTMTMVTLSSAIDPQSSDSQLSEFPESAVQPLIANASARSSASVSVGQWDAISYNYRFDGTSNSNKATYYLNKIVPDGWRVLATDSSPQRIFLHVASSDGQLGLIAYGYGHGDDLTSSRSGYRLKRLWNGFRLEKESALAWMFVSCESLSSCKSAERAISGTT